MSLLAIGIILAAVNFCYCYATDTPMEVAFERTYFQSVALFIVFLQQVMT